MDAYEDWPRLAAYVVKAMDDAGFGSTKALAAACNVTGRTLDKLRAGQQVGTRTLARVEPHLGWRPDSARKILAGGEPDLEDPGLLAIVAALAEDPRLYQQAITLIRTLSELAERPKQLGA